MGYQQKPFIDRSLPTEEELHEVYRKWYHRVYNVELHPSFTNKMAVRFTRHAMAQWANLKDPERSKP